MNGRQEIVDLATGLRTLDWSWDPAEVEPIARRFGWTDIQRSEGVLRFQVGGHQGFADFYRSETVQRLHIPVFFPPDGDRAAVRDAFARVVAYVAGALGEPTERLHRDSPKVRWRGAGATVQVYASIDVGRAGVSLGLIRNDHVDEEDRERALRALPAPELVDLVRQWRLLDWTSVDIDQVAERFGWTIDHRGRHRVALGTTFGTHTGTIEFDREHGGVAELSVAICTPTGEPDGTHRAFLHDTFATAVAALSDLLGEPAGRVTDPYARVFWRDDGPAVEVTRFSVQVDVALAIGGQEDTA